MKFDGSSWSTVLNAPTELISAWAGADGSVFTAGDGSLYKNVGSGWVNVPTGLSPGYNHDHLVSVFGFSASDV